MTFSVTSDTTGVTSDWQDSADHDINDSVPFQLTATLPANLDSYNQYYLEFADTLSAGLTYEADSLHIYAVNGSDEKEITGFFYAKESSGNLKIAISDLKGIDNIGYATINKDTKIVVQYSAKLNENAVIGSAGNPNTVKLVYSNNPNNSGDGTTKPDTPDTPDKPNEEEPPTPPNTDETPEDTVIVFTYKTVVNKVDQDGNALAGAAFALYKIVDGKETLVKEYEASSATSFEFRGLDDGDYVLKETKTPAGYNSIADVKFTINAEHEILSDSPALTSLTGTGDLTITRDTEKGEEDALKAEVQNKKGSILPSTGSVGTTMLYVVGTMLVLGAGVLLITKKRMDVK